MNDKVRANSNYPDWHYQPLRLMKDEMQNPMDVVKNFFSNINLPQARKHFKEMLEDAMCNVDAYAINYITFYDDVEKLIEASWLILQDEKKKEQPAIKANEDESLVAILQLLIAAINPERIFILTKEKEQLIDLLIIVPDKESKPFKYYETIVSTIFYSIADFSFSLHTISSVQEQLTAGSPFYLYACAPHNEVYAANNAIPLSIPQPSEEKAEERQNNWNIIEGRANDFFECAKVCFERNNLATSLFMLHQSAELSLYGLICTLWGREIKEHSLCILYRHIRRLHNPELNRLLSPATEEEKERFQLIESAYLKSRYNNTFQPSREQVTSMMEWGLDLLDACGSVARSLLAGNSEK